MLNNPPQPIPADESFLSKWLYTFRENEFQNIVERTFRDYSTDIDSKFARLDTLNTNQVRGSLFRVPFVVYENGLPTVPTAQIPLRFRILGMEVQATNGTDAATAATGVRADPISFRLIAHSAGTVNALVDEQATTTATVKALWVRTSGTEEEKLTSFPGWVEEDHSYAAGDVFQYTFENLAPPVTRLFEVRAALNLSQNPTPTGEDDDDDYKPFAPLVASVGYDDTVVRARVEALEDGAGETALHLTDLETGVGQLAEDFYAATLGTTAEEKNRLAGRYIISPANVVRTYASGATARHAAITSLVPGELFSFELGGSYTTAASTGRYFKGVTVLGNGFAWSVDATAGSGMLIFEQCRVFGLRLNPTAATPMRLSSVHSQFYDCTGQRLAVLNLNFDQTQSVAASVTKLQGCQFNLVNYAQAQTLEYHGTTAVTNATALNDQGFASGAVVLVSGAGAGGAWPAFTAGAVDDVTKVFSATAPANVRTSEVEFTSDAGTTWLPATANMRAGDVFSVPVTAPKAVNTVGLRVRFGATRAASPPLYNQADFTAPTVAPAGVLADPNMLGNGGWNNLGGWVFDNGVATGVSTSSYIYQDVSIVVGADYRVTGKVTLGPGATLHFVITGLGVPDNLYVTADGVFEFIRTAADATTRFHIQATGGTCVLEYAQLSPV